MFSSKTAELRPMVGVLKAFSTVCSRLGRPVTNKRVSLSPGIESVVFERASILKR